MGVVYHRDIEQGTDEWLSLRLGVLTSSELSTLFTKTLNPSYSEGTKTLAYKKAAERVNGRIGEHFMSSKMERGHTEEILAIEKYRQSVGPVDECGFVTNDDLGFIIGCSPDGLCGDDGGAEVKSRDEHFQMRTIYLDEVPDEFILQIQDSLLITGRKYWDFLSYSNGMPMYRKRVFPDLELHEKIKERRVDFEHEVCDIVDKFKEDLEQGKNLYPTEWVDHEEYIGEIL